MFTFGLEINNFIYLNFNQHSMKKFKLFILLGVSLSMLAQEKNVLVLKTDVSEATVFINGAQVIRKKSVELFPGNSTIKFSNLSPYIDGKSVQLKVNDQVMVLSVNHQLNFTDSMKQSNELNKLESQLEIINNKIEIENTNLEIIKEELAFLNNNRNIGGTTQGINLTNLKEAALYYHERIAALKFKDIDVNKSIDKLNKEKNAFEQQEKTLGKVKKTPTGEVIVKVESKTAVKCDMELSYFVNNAGWYPSYDIRANTIEDPIELIYKANLHQDTKEEWKNVKLRISSANPNIGNVAPQLQTYLLNYYTKPPKYNGSTLSNQVIGIIYDEKTNETLPGVGIMIKGTTIGTISNVDGSFTLSIPNGGGQLEISYIGYEKQVLPISNSQMNIYLKEDHKQLAEVVVVGYGTNKVQDQLSGRVAGISIQGTSSLNAKKGYTPLPTNQIENQTTVEFEIKTPYSVSSDNKNITIEVERYNLPAYYEYYCVPKVDKDAFLLANIVDWEKYNLLEGEANIFFENTFIGKTILDVRYTSDTLSLSLGRDKNVQVNREKVKDSFKKQLFGNKKEETKSWKITVKNNKKQPINFVLLDQIPVSTMEEIEVIPENLSGGTLSKDKGEVKWKFTMKPASKNELELKYKVKYPKERTLSIE